jgi:autotransporter-associated beta strand protein
VGLNQFWLQEANVTAGNFVVQSGVLGLNTISVTNGSVRVKPGAELRLFRGTSGVTTNPCLLTRPIVLEAGALLSYTGNETADGIDQSIASAITLEGDASIQAGGGVGNSAGSVFEIAGPISGAFGIIKTSTNILLLSGANTYRGNTTISAGTLRLGATNSLPSSIDYDLDSVPETGDVIVTGNFDLNGFSVTLNGLSGGGTVDTLAGGTPMLTVGKSDQAGIFNGVIKNSAGSLSLAKIGTNTLTLSGANTYGGGTLVSAGRLLVNNASGSGTGIGAVTVTSDGTLGGAGSINGPVTIEFGGTLAPGTSIGKLTLNSNLVLHGVALMEIARTGAGLTNDLVTGIKTITYGGMLIVTNIGTAPLQVGDSFRLFSANSYAGAFEEIIYPTGYVFTNTFGVDGRIGVAALVSPIAPNFTAGGLVQLSDGNISLTATGAVGSPYQLWATTNLSLLPLPNPWLLLTNGTVPAGPFTVIDATATNFSQRFYRFSLP